MTLSINECDFLMTLLQFLVFALLILFVLFLLFVIYLGFSGQPGVNSSTDGMRAKRRERVKARENERNPYAYRRNREEQTGRGQIGREKLDRRQSRLNPFKNGAVTEEPLPPAQPAKPTIDLMEAEGSIDVASSILNRPPTSLRTRSKLYHYTALVTDVYDGDTVTVDVDLGLNMWVRNQRIRLWKIDTPELRGDERTRGLEARDFVRDLILHRYVILRTILDKRGLDQTGKYGRLLGEILIEDEDGEVLNLNELLLAKGLAVPFGTDGAAIAPIESTAPLPSQAPMPENIPMPDPAEPSHTTPQEGTMSCPYCGETRSVDLTNQVVLNCSNCMDGSYWFSQEEQSYQPL